MPVGDGLTVMVRQVPQRTPSDILAAPMVFPAVLGDFEFEEDAQHTDFDTVSAGEFSIPAPGGRDAPRLKRFELEILAPERAGAIPWLIDETVDFDRVHRELFDILHSKKPVHLTATLMFSLRTEFDNEVTVRSVGRQLRHAQLGVRYFVASFVQWRDTSSERRAVQHAEQFPAKHRLADSDTGHSLSKRYYGTAAGALTILYANGLRRWGKGERIVLSHKFKTGDMLTIPKPKTASINRPGGF